MSSMWIQLIHCLPLATSPPPLPIGAPGPSLKIGVMILQGARARRQDDPGPDDRPPDAQRLDRARDLLALPADDRQEIVARRARLVELFVALRTVVADRRALDEDLGTRSGLLDRGDQLLGAVDPAVANLALDLRVPAVGEDVVAGQVDDRVAAVDLLLPAARRRRIARDDLVRPHRAVAADLVGIPRQDDRLMAVIQQATWPGDGRSVPNPPR